MSLPTRKYIVGIETIEFGLRSSLPMELDAEQYSAYAELLRAGKPLAFFGEQEDGSRALQVFGKELVAFGRTFLEVVAE